MSTCDICDEKYTSKVRRQITCDQCHNENCLQCFRNFLLKSEDFSPKCMHCDKVYSYIEIAEITKDKTFCKKVLDNFVKNSLIAERNKFTIYQEELARERKIEQLNEEIEQARIEFDRKVFRLRRAIHVIKNNKDTTLLNYTFIKQCSVRDCNGMLDKDWKCGTCSQETCSKCHQHKAEGHVCDEDDVKTVEAIEKESKPCPNCGVGISKIDGCDQMWCIQCQTAFSWKSGNILVNQNIHNPEYFRYRRERGLDIPRAPGDDPAILMDDLFDPLNAINHFQVTNIIERKTPELLKQAISADTSLLPPREIVNFFGTPYQIFLRNLTTQNNMDEKCKKAGIKLLKQQIDHDKWETTMKTYTKRFYYDTKLANIFRELKEKSSDILKEIIIILDQNDAFDKEIVDSMVKKIKDFTGALQETNENVENYAKLFNYKNIILSVESRVRFGTEQRYIAIH